MSGETSEPRYRACAPDARIIQPLDAMTLVYHRPSGITHMVAEPVPQILEAMGEESLSISELIQRLSQSFDLGGNAEALVAERLAELARLGLVDEVRD